MPQHPVPNPWQPPHGGHALTTGLLILFMVSCAPIDRSTANTATVSGGAADSDRVSLWFATDQNPSSTRLTFPEVSWDDVDALLARAEDETRLTRFPLSPFSSQSQSECSVGVLALWFIEGIRRNERGGYPSNNPLLLGPHRDARGWLADSEQNRGAALAAYREWWEKVEGLSVPERAALDPLAGTGISWH